MSIIEKALRQAQEPLLTPQPPAVHAPQPSAEPPAAPAPVHSWQAESAGRSASAATAPSTKMLVLVAAAVLASTAALVIGGAVWLKRTLADRNEAVTAPAAALTPAILPAPTASPAPSAAVSSPPAQRSTTAQSAPVLTGVIGGSGAAYAMIDGQIVGEGEAVGAWTVQTIRGSTVTLHRPDGATTTLHLQQ